MAMCECLKLCWVPEIVEPRPHLPMPMHHPNCEHFKQEAFAKVTHDGVSCIMEINEAASMVAESDEHYELCNILLTRDQFENLKEFTGF